MRSGTTSCPLIIRAIHSYHICLQSGTEGGDAAHIGKAATIDNRYYRKAVTTEIMQSVNIEGGLRKYIMHGVWQSTLDHENSHLDARFQKAAGPVGAFVIQGPVEPFYETRILVNKK